MIDSEPILQTEWVRLVQLCARLTGDRDAAEDLAQETLIEAWRHAEALRDPDKRAPWLSGIARNVCLRWLRRYARESAYRARIQAEDAATTSGGHGGLADAFDVALARAMMRHTPVLLILDEPTASLDAQTEHALFERYTRPWAFSGDRHTVGVRPAPRGTYACTIFVPWNGAIMTIWGSATAPAAPGRASAARSGRRYRAAC